MKSLLVVLIIIAFGVIGYKQKEKLINQKKLIDKIKEYVLFYDSNLSVFKNDLTMINSSYINMQNNKSANNVLFILKNDNLYQYNYELLKIKLKNCNELELITSFFRTIGSLEYKDEKTKNSEMINVLKNASMRFDNDIRTKGDLYFKILLAVGAVIGILIW